LGPRNTRRLAWTGTGVAAVALIVASVLLTRSNNHTVSRSSASGSKSADAASPAQAGSSEDGHVPQNFYERGHVVGKLVYGMTMQQVRRRVGRPVKVIHWQGMPCWQYTVNEHVPADDVGPGYTLNASAACFLARRYAIPRYKINGKWGYNLRTKEVTD
jgi:hypothetical protein